MRNVNMLERVCEILREERLTRSSAVIVGLILIMVVHAPILPVVMGCVLALGISVIRSLSRQSNRVPARRQS
jgi:hypothetical protein